MTIECINGPFELTSKYTLKKQSFFPYEITISHAPLGRELEHIDIPKSPRYAASVIESST